MPLLEKSIEDKVVKWARTAGWLALKVNFVEKGFPDRLFIYRGHTIFLEFKKPGEKPEALQEFRIAELQRQGIPAFWVDNAITAISFLKAAMEPSPVPGASHKDATVSSIRRAVPRPGTGKDQHRLGDVQDPKEQEFGSKDANRRAPAPDVQGLAGRDKEVE
jgi:hypothetical protein